MNGKDKCRILKEIRRQIAKENDIDLVIRECTHKGDCRGTCPRCEAEVRYLERELEKRRRLKKRVALAGISAGVMLTLSGCGVIDQVMDHLPLPGGSGNPVNELTGAVAYDPEPDIEVTEGEAGSADSIESEPELLVLDGEVAPYDYIGSEPEICVTGEDSEPYDLVDVDDPTMGMVAPEDMAPDAFSGS